MIPRSFIACFAAVLMWMGALSCCRPADATTASSQAALSPDTLSTVHYSLPDPTGPPLGVDVSHWQEEVNWTQVRQAGIVFGYSQPTQGLTYNDATFPQQWAGMKQAGILRGAIHFFIAGDDGASQAKHFLSVLGNDMGELPPALDLEGQKTADGGTGAFAVSNTISAAELVAEAQAWLQTVEQQVGMVPVIYTDPGFANTYLTDPSFARYPLWVADWTSAAEPELPQVWSTSDWTFWQYSDLGVIPGFQDTVDLDRFNGTLQQLSNLGKKGM